MARRNDKQNPHQLMLDFSDKPSEKVKPARPEEQKAEVRPIKRSEIMETEDKGLLQGEELLSLAQAARIIPRRRAGKPAHPCTIYRWASKGLRQVKLETTQIGGTLCTSREALARFFMRLTEAREDLKEPPVVLPSERAREIKEADERAARLLQ